MEGVLETAPQRRGIGRHAAGIEPETIRLGLAAQRQHAEVIVEGVVLHHHHHDVVEGQRGVDRARRLARIGQRVRPAAGRRRTVAEAAGRRLAAAAGGQSARCREHGGGGRTLEQGAA